MFGAGGEGACWVDVRRVILSLVWALSWSELPYRPIRQSDEQQWNNGKTIPFSLTVNRKASPDTMIMN